MARPDPDKLAKALRTNLRRRKSGAPAATPSQPAEDPEPAPEKPPETSGAGQG